MKKATTLLLALPLLGLLPLAGFSTSEAQRSHGHWTTCREHLDWKTESIVIRSHCWSVPMHRVGTPLRWWSKTKWISPHVRAVIRYPVYPVARAIQTAPRGFFRPLSRSSASARCYQVTGYWPSLHHVADPGWSAGAVPGVVANNWLPWGTHVTAIDVYGRVVASGDVHDRIGWGSQFDFVSNNPYALTGCYRVIIG